MITREELRIGNLLLGSMYYDTDEAVYDLGEEYSESEEWIQTVVEGIPHEAEGCLAWTDEEFERLKPIPLSEEWLLKFGFVKKESKISGTTYFFKGLRIAFWEEVAVWYKSEQLFEKRIYVHNLQNLFHSLTGNELQIQESK